jgi:D-methionine transport system permease protein
MIITPFNPHLIIDISIGLTTLIFPLHIAAISIYVRVSVAALREVDHGLVEATLTKGCSIWQIIVKISHP